MSYLVKIGTYLYGIGQGAKDLWILATTNWDDGGIWEDTDVWMD